MILVTFCFAIVILARAKAGGDSDGSRQLSNIQSLKDHLFKNYDKNTRPVTHHTNETLVLINIIPSSVIDLDEERNLFALDGWLVLYWNDERLMWNSSDYEGLENLHLPDHFVWQPDIVLYNGHSGKLDPKINTHLVVTHYGDVWFVPPVEIQTFCPLYEDNSYPNDIVTCTIEMGSWAHDGWQMNITLFENRMYLDHFENSNPRWEVLTDQVNLSRIVRHFNCCEEPYVHVSASFVMKRRPPPELKVIWAPCVLVMTLTLTMFWIPSGSGKKVFLGTILFLVLSVLTVYVGAVTKSPRSPKYAVSFLESTMYAVASAIVLEILVINLSSIVGPCRPPDTIVRLLSGPLAKYIGVWPRWVDSVPGDRIQLKDDIEQIDRHPTPKDEWILIATGLDRILFVLYIIILATIHQV